MEFNNYGCANYCERQVESLLRATAECPNLNWEDEIFGLDCKCDTTSSQCSFLPCSITFT